MVGVEADVKADATHNKKTSFCGVPGARRTVRINVVRAGIVVLLLVRVAVVVVVVFIFLGRLRDRIGRLLARDYDVCCGYIGCSSGCFCRIPFALSAAEDEDDDEDEDEDVEDDDGALPLPLTGLAGLTGLTGLTVLLAFLELLGGSTGLILGSFTGDGGAPAWACSAMI